MSELVKSGYCPNSEEMVFGIKGEDEKGHYILRLKEISLDGKPNVYEKTYYTPESWEL